MTISTLIDNIDSTQLEVLKYSNNPVLFMTEILNLDCEPFHQEWLKTFEDNKFTVLLAPRGHGKTTAIGSYITWRICKNRRIRVLIITINQAKANNMMTFVQESLTKNQKLINLFGVFKGNTEWSRNSIRVKQSVSGIPIIEPTLEVMGRGSRLVSSHYDLIVLDDVIDDDSSRTEARRRETEDWYDGPLIGTFRGNTKLINIGTRWGEDDFHQFLMNKVGFVTLKYKALLNRRKYDEGLEEAKVLWPSRRPWNSKMALENGLSEDVMNLEFIRKHQGERFFQMQYQNNIIASGISKFKEEWIESAIRRYRLIKGIYPLDMKKYMGVDIGGEDKKSDYCSITIAGIDKDGIIYVLDQVKTHASLHRQVELIKSMDELHHVSKIGIDSSAQQKLITSEWIKNNPSLPIVPIKLSRANDRETRTDRLTIIFETNRICINPMYEDLINELRVYPRGKNDDAIDSLSFALEISQEGSFIDWSRAVNNIVTRRKYEIRTL